MLWVFYVSLALLIYAYVVFPAAMAVVILFERRRFRSYEPSIAVLVPARNEVSCIARKIENTLAVEYPGSKLSVIVASNGSTDGTEAVASRFAEQGVQTAVLPAGSGKAGAVNHMGRIADAEILVFTDADVLIDPTALRAIARRFSDIRVGAVCARRAVRRGTNGAPKWTQRVHLFYESMIKRGEGVLGRVMGADGALYAVRRDCFSPVPPNAPDDFVTVLRVLKSGMKAVYETSAVAYEAPAFTGRGGELSRRRRTVARGMTGFLQERKLANPLRFPLSSLLLLSHKVLRWFGGYILGVVWVSNVFLVAHPRLRWCLAAQTLCYALALSGCVLRNGAVGRVPALFRYFVLSNFGAAMGIMDVLMRRDWTAWQTQRK